MDSIVHVGILCHGERRSARLQTLLLSLANRVGEVQLISELCVLRTVCCYLVPAVGASVQRQLMIVELELERRVGEPVHVDDILFLRYSLH
jgi:hypothetical protein